jgi:hypothetical protein
MGELRAAGKVGAAGILANDAFREDSSLLKHPDHRI